MAIRDGKIIGVGSNTEILALRGTRTKVVDALVVIVPGLQDSHIHPVSIAAILSCRSICQHTHGCRAAAKSSCDLKTRIKATPAMVEADRAGDGSHPLMFTRWDIDKTTPENPAYLSAYRRLAVNTP